MLAELKRRHRLLNGFRSAAKADVTALSGLIARRCPCWRHGMDKDIAEIELNPVLVHAEGQGVTIVDALVVAKR